jgi:GTP-binding protein EngB required for normal cell division
VHTINRSSYGRIVKVIKHVATLSRAATLRLPRIIVVGSESSGKSSTIERIAGFSLFPRDAKICTRMPIKFSLINAADAVANVTLLFAGRADILTTEAEAASG